MNNPKTVRAWAAIFRNYKNEPMIVGCAAQYAIFHFKHRAEQEGMEIMEVEIRPIQTKKR